MPASSMRSKPSSQPTKDEILSVLDGSVRRFRVSPLYFIGLLIVSVGMVILPIVYAALIVGVGYALYYHATNHADMLSFGVGIRWRAILFMTPFLVGPLLIAFMIKPFFSRDRRKATGLIIDKQNEPLLPAYIEKLCRSMGSPVPQVIMVDCDINASASLTHGIFGRSVTLTIGMPLVSYLTLRELTGILAHEFGHFTQRFGMRLSYLIRSINAWFYRVVYERDHWDERLDLALESDSRLGFALMLAQFFIWLTRKILWGLMMIGHAISCFLMRQMEYDADWYEASVAGPATFTKASCKLKELGIATEVTYAQLSSSWQERRLVDHLPAMIADAIADIPPKVIDAIHDESIGRSTRIFDTHPSDGDRIRHVKKIDTKGIVHRDGPATLLFHNFDAVAKAATLVHYREMISPHINPKDLVSVKSLRKEREKTQREQNAVEHYFGHPLYASRPVFFDNPFIPPAKNAVTTLKKLKAVHHRIRVALPKIIAAYTKHEKAAELLTQMTQATALKRAKARFKAADFNLVDVTQDAIDKARRRNESERREATEILVTYEKVLNMRMVLAFQLLGIPEFSERIPKANALIAETSRLIGVSARLRDTFYTLDEIHSSVAAIQVLVDVLEKGRGSDEVIETFESYMRRILSQVRASREELRDVEYPFDHARGKVSLAEYLVEYVPGDADLEAAADSVVTFNDNLAALYLRIIGRLAYSAGQVERAAGLTSQQHQEA